MSEQPTDADGSQPVPGTQRGAGGSRRHERAGGWRRAGMGRRSSVAARREAVLRVLMEAYRRDVGRGTLDPR